MVKANVIIKLNKINNFKLKHRYQILNMCMIEEEKSEFSL